MALISARGVKYCPAPDLLSFAFFIEQTLVEIAEIILLHTEPIDLIEGFNQLFQMAWFTQAGLGIGVDRTDEGIVVHEVFLHHPRPWRD